MLNTLTQAEWIARCADRLLQIDPQLSGDEVMGLAQEFFSFQRTAAMSPEAAADFVASELAKAEPRFERRTTPRT
jgi:hypothetical protein